MSELKMSVQNLILFFCITQWTLVSMVVCDMEKPGKCLPWAGSGNCITSCSTDWDCSGLQKCCSIQCGRMCQDPCPKSCDNVTCVSGRVCQVIGGCGQCVVGSAKPVQLTETKSNDKPGSCLPWNGPGPCVKNCVNDGNCPGAKKCCTVGCGKLCQDPCQTTCAWNCIAGRECKLIDGCAQCIPIP